MEHHGETIREVVFVARAVMMDSAGRVLIAQRPEGDWCLPGGKFEDDEVDPYVTHAREIEEEAGLELEKNGADELLALYREMLLEFFS